MGRCNPTYTLLASFYFTINLERQPAERKTKLEVPKDVPMDQVEVIISQAKENSKLKDAIIAYLDGSAKAAAA